MSEWLNKQNKKHILLYAEEDALNNQDSVIWFELALFQKPNRLNKKLTKIAPRRHKREAAKTIKRLLNKDVTTDLFLEDIKEILENERS